MLWVAGILTQPLVYQPITEAGSKTRRREPLSAARWMAVAGPVC